MKTKPWDVCAGQSPLDPFELATEGGGAEGTSGYLAVRVRDGREFYAESTPVWWVPGRFYDLRDTWTTFYLRELEPISIAPGYRPHVFIAAYMPDGAPGEGARIAGWHHRTVLSIGKDDWAPNEILLTTDERSWSSYPTNDPAVDTLDRVLAHCGFLGWSFTRLGGTAEEMRARDARAGGAVGFDEFRYNLRRSDLEDLRAGRPLENSLDL